MTVKQTITSCLWFDGNAEEAANFYVSLLPDSRIEKIVRAPTEYPGGAAGSVLTVEFTLAGRQFLGLNGGPQFPFTEAVSFIINCETQDEVDRYWEKLTAGGGSPGQCGWLKDRFGLSWQVIPTVLLDLLQDKDPRKSQRVMQALMQMTKLDIAGLKQAHSA
jgi:predicted 3-demethylubiquinone-9 3-methyltransferase (glyoxalase superfamily)